MKDEEVCPQKKRKTKENLKNELGQDNIIDRLTLLEKENKLLREKMAKSGQEEDMQQQQQQQLVKDLLKRDINGHKQHDQRDPTENKKKHGSKKREEIVHNFRLKRLERKRHKIEAKRQKEAEADPHMMHDSGLQIDKEEEQTTDVLSWREFSLQPSIEAALSMQVSSRYKFTYRSHLQSYSPFLSTKS